MHEKATEGASLCQLQGHMEGEKGSSPPPMVLEQGRLRFLLAWCPVLDVDRSYPVFRRLDREAA